jgi:hypothetical protein
MNTQLDPAFAAFVVVDCESKRPLWPIQRQIAKSKQFVIPLNRDGAGGPQ